MGLTTKEIGSSSFNNMISSVDRRSEYVENRANANVTLNNFLTPYTLDNKSSILNAPCGYSNGKYASLRPEYKLLPNEIIDEDSITLTGWSRNGNVYSAVNASSNVGLNYLNGNPGFNYSIGDLVKVSFTISDYVQGGVKIQFSNGGSASYTPLASANGTYTYTLKLVGNNTSGAILSDGTSPTLKVSNVSFRKVQEADFDFSRGSSATRVNEKGLIEDVQILSGNLVQNGDFDTDLNGWQAYSSSLISWESGGYAVVSNNSGYWGIIRQNNVFEIGKTYEITMTAKSSLANKNLHTPFFFGQSFSEVDTFQTFTQYFEATTTAFSVGFSNVSAFGEVTITIDNVSVIEITDDTDIPRIDYTDGTGALLLEPQSTNKVTQSETFSTWSTTNASITSTNLAAPDGSTSVIKMSSSGIGGGEHKVRFNVDTNPATSSIFAKMGEVRYIMNRRQVPATNWQSVVFDLQEGVVAANNYSSNAYPKITHYGNGWYRCEVYYPNVGHVETGWGLSNGTDQNYTATNTTDGLYIWGVQQEDLSFATSYIPTEGSTVTRSAELANNSGNADLFNDSEGVLYAEIFGLADDRHRQLTISNGSNSNTVAIMLKPGLNRIDGYVNSGGSNQALMFAPLDTNQFNKIAVKYKENDFALWLNGVEVATDTSGSTPTGLNELAFDKGNGGDNFYGNVKSLAVFKEALTDFELAELTSSVKLNPFTFTVKTDRSGTSNTDQFTLPLTDNGTVDIVVFWGDGTSDAITAFDQAEKTHTYPSLGTYEIKITGTLQGFRFNNTGDKTKMVDIKKWGIFDINMQSVFRNCLNLTQSATDTPIISTTNLANTFQVAQKFNGDVSNWDVSSVTNFNSMFHRANLFNRDISSWDVSSATNLSLMFKDAKIFNKDIGSWDVSNNDIFKEMFRGARDFNQPIGSWTIKNVGNQNINMQRMFRDAISFDQSLANWDMEKVNNLQDFLLNAGLSTASYDATLIGWAAQTVQSGLTCDFGNSQYTAGGAAEAARNTLINTYGWTITDGGAA